MRKKPLKKLWIKRSAANDGKGGTITLYEKIDSALSRLPAEIERYFKVPDFAECEQPRKWLICYFSDTTELNAENAPWQWTFYVTIAVYTPQRADLSLNRAIIKAMHNEGFTYNGGSSSGDLGEYPQKHEYTMEFMITFPLDLTAEESEV